MEKRQMRRDDVAISDENRRLKDGVNVNTVDIGPEHW